MLKGQIRPNLPFSIWEAWGSPASTRLSLQPRQPLPGIFDFGLAAMIRKLYEVDSMICPQ
jgi:hypothetical protein